MLLCNRSSIAHSHGPSCTNLRTLGILQHTMGDAINPCASVPNPMDHSLGCPTMGAQPLARKRHMTWRECQNVELNLRELNSSHQPQQMCKQFSSNWPLFRGQAGHQGTIDRAKEAPSDIPMTAMRLSSTQTRLPWAHVRPDVTQATHAVTSPPGKGHNHVILIVWGSVASYVSHLTHGKRNRQTLGCS